jgi:hypothetical protein
MGFTKLDDRLIASSIVREPDSVFKIFIVLLSLTDPDSVARITAPGLAGCCNMKIETVRKALKRLESPDPDSRSTEGEGRRIKRVDGGYFVINYLRYRERTYSDSPAAIEKRKYRERRGSKKAKDGQEGEENKSLSLTEAEAEAEMSGQCPKVSGQCPDNVRSTKSRKGIFFVGGEWRGLTPAMVDYFKSLFPCSDILEGLGKMAAWISEDPARDDPTKDRTAFIERWLSRPGRTK